MTQTEEKIREKLFKALKLLLYNSVDHFGYPKKATIKQLYKAKNTITDYENWRKQKVSPPTSHTIE